jgi:hypothetical protein
MWDRESQLRLGCMHAHLNNHIAREHVNDLLADAERDRLVRAARVQTRTPRLTARLTAVARRRQPAPTPRCDVRA